VKNTTRNGEPGAPPAGHDARTGKLPTTAPAS